MAGDSPLAGSGGPASGGAADRVKTGIDLRFGSVTLPQLRAEVLACARLAGMPEERAGDVVLAVHELAANAIRHGAGEGRLRIWNLSGELRCQVDDGDPLAPGAADAMSRALIGSWPDRPGHGLWVVRQVADQMQILSGPRGTRAIITFALP